MRSPLAPTPTCESHHSHPPERLRARLGHGVGLRTAHFSHLLEEPARGVDWFEITSENFFEPGGRPHAALERVRADLPVAAHGVSLGVGNLDPVSPAYLAALKGLIDRIEPVWVSDHLCWGAYRGVYGHDLWPLPFSEEALCHVVDRVRQVQDALGRRLLIENVSSYVTFAESTIPEWEFLSALAQRADCGILLDVNNVYVSSRNHGFDAERYIDAIPAERVGYVHLAGHTDQGGYLFDSHSRPVPPPVWALFARLLRRVGEVDTLVEWDEDVPPFAEVAAQSALARRYAEEALHAHP